MAEEVELRDVTKRYGATAAVERLNLRAASGQRLVILGPSGCGKTTTLRLIAGLERPDEGDVLLGGRVATRWPPRRRNAAFVMQHAPLYPHLDVAGNLAFSLKLRRAPREEIERRVGEAARLLQLEPLLRRRPDELSGGERQRVALGRALVRRPAILLLDEPLTDLDAPLRAALRGHLARVHQRLGATTVHVTHEQREAMLLADQLAIMRRGCIVQVGPPLAVYERPACRFVAQFLGDPPMNLVPGRLTPTERGWRFQAERAELAVELPGRAAGRGSPAGGRALLGLRPEHVRFADPGDQPGSWRRIEGVIAGWSTSGDRHVAELQVGGETVLATAPPDVRPPIGPAVVFFDAARCVLFDAATERNLAPPE